MRLIDADKLQEDLEKVKKESASLVDISHIIGFQSVVDAQPTAYDVDKVVEQLEEQRKMYEQESEELEKMRDDPNQIIYRRGKMRGFEYSKEIVKAGGIDD